MRIGALSVALVVLAGVAQAQSLGAVAPASTVVALTPLEWFREFRPKIGREVTVLVDGVARRTIEWRYPVEVRVRTKSGAALTGAEQAAIRDRAVVCRQGVPTNASTTTELGGTFVVEFDCVRLQSYAAQ